MDLASKLSVRIRIERKMVTRDPKYGTETVSWAEFACVWAEVKDILPSRAERMADHIQIARRHNPSYACGLRQTAPDMRVIIDNRIHQIIAGPSMLGRREAVELMVEEHSSEGAAP